jgi:hypothetical protein
MYSRSKKHRIVLTLLVCLLIASLFGCGKQNPSSPPTITNPVYRPSIALNIEIDTPPLYGLGHTVALAVANKIDAMATRINSGGLLIFVCLISSHSFEDCPVNFKTPAILSFVLPPSVPHCGSDPYACSQLKQAYQKALASWQVIHASQLNNVAQVRAWVHTQTDKIRSLTFRYDDTGSDIFGALATASQNLQGVKAAKYLLLASDLVSTTTRQDVGQFSLSGVQVEAIFRTCTDNKTCQQYTAYWLSVARSAGALSFHTYSPAQSQALGLQAFL